MFVQHPYTYGNDEARAAYIMGLLMGDALTWATWDMLPPLWSALFSFTTELSKVFNNLIQEKEAAKRLLSLCQGPCSVVEYSVKICVLTA